MLKLRRATLGVLLSGVMLLIGGCSQSSLSSLEKMVPLDKVPPLSDVSSSHPLLADSEGGAAKVYFIRPHTERRMGISDNALIMEFNGQQALTLGKGEYVVLNLIPRDYSITLKNQTEVGPRWDVKWMSKKYKFSFEADKTYYIELKSIDGEFRGIFFVAKDMARYDAKQLAQLQGLRAAGRLARQSPL